MKKIFLLSLSLFLGVFSFNLNPVWAATEDNIVKATLAKGKTSVKPKIIFLAGIPGSGKTSIIDKLDRANYLDKSAFIHVDSDDLMVQTDKYQEDVRKKVKDAASLNFLSGIGMRDQVFNGALEQSKNIIFDSTFRSMHVIQDNLDLIKTKYPQYELEVVYVKADLDVAKQRVAARGKITGRYVPDDVLTDAISVVPDNVAEISKEIRVITVDNNSPHTAKITSVTFQGKEKQIDVSLDSPKPDLSPLTAAIKATLPTDKTVPVCNESSAKCCLPDKVKKEIWQRGYERKKEVYGDSAEISVGRWGDSPSETETFKAFPTVPDSSLQGKAKQSAFIKYYNDKYDALGTSKDGMRSGPGIYVVLPIPKSAKEKPPYSSANTDPIKQMTSSQSFADEKDPNYFGFQLKSQFSLVDVGDDKLEAILRKAPGLSDLDTGNLWSHFDRVCTKELFKEFPDMIYSYTDANVGWAVIGGGTSIKRAMGLKDLTDCKTLQALEKDSTLQAELETQVKDYFQKNGKALCEGEKIGRLAHLLENGPQCPQTDLDSLSPQGLGIIMDIYRGLCQTKREDYYQEWKRLSKKVNAQGARLSLKPADFKEALLACIGYEKLARAMTRLYVVARDRPDEIKGELSQKFGELHGYSTDKLPEFEIGDKGKNTECETPPSEARFVKGKR